MNPILQLMTYNNMLNINSFWGAADSARSYESRSSLRLILPLSYVKHNNSDSKEEIEMCGFKSKYFTQMHLK